jgi:hypothetical protein
MYEKLVYQSLGCASIAFALLMIVGCSSKEAAAHKAVQEYLKNQGIQDLKVDLFCTDPGLPNQAYVSVTATYNFATANGTLQREYLGFILKHTGQQWVVDKNTAYTKDRKTALAYLGGSKGV